jgi:predicted methyltransferase
MRALVAAAVAALAISACAGGAVPGLLMTEAAEVQPTSPHIIAAIADPRRPDADRERDALRHPADILAFAGVSPGMRIADIGPGGGYYTRLFAVAVGEDGRAVAIDRPNSAPDRPRAILAVAPQYQNVIVIQAGYQGWSAPEPLDAVFVSQIYHDWFYPQLGVSAEQINREVFAALKPGGVYVIIDHAAPDGTTIDTNPQTSLHRIDRAQVIREVTAAGFVLDGESNVLRNPADNRSVRVFEGDIRGRTDQFVLRFRKPA